MDYDPDVPSHGRLYKIITFGNTVNPVFFKKILYMKKGGVL
jgi:hypothetical protein